MSEIKHQEIKNKIDLAINQLRPFLNDDGGDIEVIEISNDNILRLRLLGACKDCSMSNTTKAGIENALKQAVPQLKNIYILED